MKGLTRGKLLLFGKTCLLLSVPAVIAIPASAFIFSSGELVQTAGHTYPELAGR
jgi:hypothetical protein